MYMAAVIVTKNNLEYTWKPLEKETEKPKK